MKQRLQEAADEDEFGPHIVHFDCLKYLAHVHRLGDEPIVFGKEGAEVCPAVYDGLVGDAYSDLRTAVAERASDFGLAKLYASILRREVSHKNLPYDEINNLRMTASSYKHVMAGPVYSIVRNFMRFIGVQVVNDADSFLVE